jgi:DNA-binding CsgD family transcriptional regulator
MATNLKTIRSVTVTVTLTERQIQILKMIVAGRTTKEIASELCVCRSRAAQLCGGIYALIGVQDKVGAAVWAVRRGIA